MSQVGTTYPQNGTTERKKTFSERNSEKVKKCEEKQERLRTWAGKSRKFTPEEQSALRIDSKEAFKEFWEVSLDAKDNFDIEHDDRPGRLGQGATHLASSAYDILQNVSPMVSIIKDFGAPYGSMAIGTICFLFANRTTMEKKILATLVDIQDRLPGVRMYQHIYNDDHELDQQLQTKIVDAYDSFIDFSISASEFYSCGTIRRWIRAIQGTAEVDALAERVQKTVVDVRLVCEELLSKNVNAVKENLREVKQQNVELKGEIGGLKSQISDMQNHHDIEVVRKLLGLEAVSDAAQLAQLERHRRNVAAEFQESNCYAEMTPEQHLQEIEKGSDFQDWFQPKRSGLLVLSGRNEVVEASHCWVSPLALDLAAKLASENADSAPCVFYLLGHLSTGDTTVDVLSSLILQLLSLNKEALRVNRARFAELRAELEDYAHAAQSPRPRANDLRHKLRSIALRAVGLFDSNKTVWIVLDRVDQCRAMLYESTRNPHRRDGRSLLQAMVHLVEKAAVTVKVLAVVNRVDWHVEGDELGAEREESVVVRAVSQNEDN
ncbi:hypothetical protein B0T24DRAFT_667819 [Lasiosphaeria ovina]|uniref:DUF7708 domain-containing protein n=1 Tax=Lasiosphaeria ovina TaxID=92902 RepID=A0AAE0K7Q0_9PEZI|nr:hypothetical protein B0T24DRAFT_667819 [Lasiosphaeria ovina]